MVSLIDEVKKLEKMGQTKFSYSPPSRMKTLYACKVLSENGYNPIVTRNDKGIIMIECELNAHRYSFTQGEISPIKIILVSADNLHPSLNSSQRSLVLKNPELFFHILQCDERYLWLSHLGSKTKQGANKKAERSLKLISFARKYKSVNKSLMEDIFKFIGVPIPQGSK